MFVTKPIKLTLTLFLYVALVFTLSASSEAKSFQHVQHRDHVNLKRLIKKRSPLPQATTTPLVPLAGAAPPPPTFSSESTTSSAVSSSDTATSSTSSSASETSLSTSVSESSSSSSQSVSESTSFTQSSSTSTAPTSTIAISTSEKLNLGEASPTPSVEVVKPTITKTQSVDADSTGTTIPLPQSNTSKTKSTTLTVIIIVAASVAGVAILWTVFRKWKLGRSKKFDERLQPIDWQPTNQDDGNGIVPPHRRASTGASSFHSGSGHGNSPVRGVGGYSGSEHGHSSSDHGHILTIPDHDFTAGSSTLAPVGGYADLARGSSPQPQMHQMNRGPSLTRPAYDIGVPLHHQAGYGTQDTYDYNDGGRRY
ncbi:hypothetical protein BDZ94DRAFT_1368125 [Collybia nuda]|uniref:Uncharacterized protein n=1 Tax=Collybia nuda TaxID=64659 RepID=A0A9P6CIR8_9AGAR|nr:hypothetical protein BDZ94DRAFT_1368125 [Collybia nuda]